MGQFDKTDRSQMFSVKQIFHTFQFQFLNNVKVTYHTNTLVFNHKKKSWPFTKYTLPTDQSQRPFVSCSHRCL